jgi:4-diphosphocytidyl-2-C-methyl-D-erythritol kinase
MIPLGAGLGGGSSNGAFMLKGLNSMFNLNLTEDQLCDYASRLGSDCSFFIKNRPLYAFERGNCLKEILLFPEKIHIAVIYPGIHVSTALAYAGIQPKNPLHSLEKLIKLPPEKWKGNIFNSFEDYIVKLHPVIGEIKNKLYNTGAFYASMSGSGSAVYGLFKEQIPVLKDKFPGYFTWEGTTSS